MAGYVLGVLAALAVAMAYLTATLVRWTAESRSRTRSATVLFLLAMMAEMLAGGLYYTRNPDAGGLVVGLWVSGGAMAATALPLFALLAGEARRRAQEGRGAPARPIQRERSFLVAVVGLVLVNELLMGLVFTAAAGLAGTGPSLPAGPAWGGLLVAAVNSPWFLLTMAAEMAASTLLLRSRLPRAVATVLLLQGAIMALSPPALAVPGWAAVTVPASSLLMIVLIIYLLEHLYRHPQLPPGFARYLVELLGAYAVMMAGLFLWLGTGDGSLFAISVVLEMVIFFPAIVRPERLADGRGPAWLDRPNWTFSLLASIFVAELFMGAALDLALEPSVYPAGFPALGLSGPVGVVVLHAISNGFWFVATVTASTWFLAMMGAEMGVLAALKLRESRHRENRIRLGAMIASYAAFLVFYPSIYFAAIAPGAPDPRAVPVLGWSMGLGSFPVAPTVFGAIALTYVITGVLAALFGRRVVCSVFCSAPLMYQGTTIDAMKAFNRSSPAARHYLSSRLGRLYSVTNGLTMGALVVVTTASYLDATGRLHLTILGADPSVFFFALSFSVLWYLMFVAIPYVGDYSCVRMGYCYTGTIVQAFQKVGVFKLKVRDRDVCRACTTLDCAQGCPIGLVDMPGHFRTTGEFRSSKCCGVGECIEACPYDNLYISDIRHWVRRRRGRPDLPAGSGPRARPDLQRAAARRGAPLAFVPSSDAIPLPMVPATTDGPASLPRAGSPPS